MRTRDEYERMFGGAEALLNVERHVKRNVDAMPPLSQRQRDALAVLLVRRIPPRPEPGKATCASTLQTTAAAPATGAAA